jgi:hypothetical protein
VSDQAVGRLRWCVGMSVGFLLGMLLRGGVKSALEHPWPAAAMCATAIALALFDWLILDDDEEDYWR